MCEIAILDPSEHSAYELKGVAVELYESMHTSLGIMAVYDPDDKEKFEYDIYKAVDPDVDDVLSFVKKAQDEGALRLIIHGRLGTHGVASEKNAHPIEIDCGECDIDYIIHNGIVGMHYKLRQRHESEGHTYNTEVDTEAIAHEFGQVPDSFDEELNHDTFDREPAYILLNEDAIYIHGSRYHLTKHATMAHKYRDFSPNRTEEDYQRVIMTPTGGE